jgi:nucleoside 2-deoxyribosyltransferase
MMKKIYLAGNISNNPETYEWRKKVAEVLGAKYVISNPAANKFNRKLLRETKMDVEQFKDEAIKRSQGILIAKDFSLVKDADLIIANMKILTPEKPLIGTLFELAWCWEFHKPVIAIVGDNWFCRHPFTVKTFSATCDTVEEACDIVTEFFVD